MHGAHSGQPGVQRDQQVQRLLLTDLADDHAAGPHPQRLLDQPAQPDLAVCPRGWAAGSASPPTSGRFGRSSKTSSQVTTRSRAGIELIRVFSRVVFPAWVPPATMMFSPATTAASRNRAACAVSVPSADQVLQSVGRDHELADVQRQCSRVMSGMTDVQPAAVGEQGVDERGRQVEPPPGWLEHPLDQVADLAGGEHDGGQLASGRAGRRTPGRAG